MLLSNNSADDNSIREFLADQDRADEPVDDEQNSIRLSLLPSENDMPRDSQVTDMTSQQTENQRIVELEGIHVVQTEEDDSPKSTVQLSAKEKDTLVASITDKQNSLAIKIDEFAA